MRNALPDDTLERLIAMVGNTNLIALDKVLSNIGAARAGSIGYRLALSRVVSIRDRMEQAAIEVNRCL